MKKCTKCGTLKPFTEFSKDKYKQDGHRSACKECNKQDHIRRYTNDPDGCKNRSKEYRKKNPEKVKTSNRNTKLKRNYGITHDDYVAMIKNQSNKCACCSKETDKLVVDHNHTTGQVRELLCNQCNTALGLLNEDVTVMQNMINYTRKHNG
jgi:hypothetical protein